MPESPTYALGAARGRFRLPRSLHAYRVIDDDTEAEIAGRLGASPRTVRSHVKNLFFTLQVHTRAQAVCTALRHGLVE